MVRLNFYKQMQKADPPKNGSWTRIQILLCVAVVVGVLNLVQWNMGVTFYNIKNQIEDLKSEKSEIDSLKTQLSKMERTKADRAEFEVVRSRLAAVEQFSGQVAQLNRQIAATSEMKDLESPCPEGMTVTTIVTTTGDEVSCR